MNIVRSLVNKQLLQADADMRAGSPDDVVANAEEYLLLLEEYVVRLRDLKGIPRTGDAMASPFAAELVEQIRGAVRSAIEHATSERNRIESLLSSFTMVSGWSAAETFNLLGYKNACDWELIGTHVRTISQGANLTVTDAVVEAKRLRREAYFEYRKAA
jgi:hypothetical protein